MGVKVISIAFDPTGEQALAAAEYGITSVPMLSDADRTVSEDYGVLKWAVATGEPGHTFVLVSENGRVLWLRDYGAPENGGLMYVPVNELVSQISEKLR